MENESRNELCVSSKETIKAKERIPIILTAILLYW
jgi:hypothetical protein